jgi:hypothetical protein
MENQTQGVGTTLCGYLRIIRARDTANFDTRMSHLPAEPTGNSEA